MGVNGSKSASSIDKSIIQGDPEGCDWDQIFSLLFDEDSDVCAVFGQDATATQSAFASRPVKTYGQGIPAGSLGFVCRKGRGKPAPNQDDFFFFSSGANVVDACSESSQLGTSGVRIPTENDGMAERYTDGPWLAGVFDGHGPVGERFSAMARNWMPLLILRDPNFPEDVPQTIMNAYEKMSAMARKAVQDTRMENKLSGTTCVLVVQANGILYVGWLGDSRAVAAFSPSPDQPLASESMVVEELTRDHKPDAAIEKTLVERAGGKVHRNRVWFSPNEPSRLGSMFSNMSEAMGMPVFKPMSGLAMSRSLGDDLAHKAGVSDRPDLKMLPLSFRYENNGLVLLASDGVFEFIDSRSAVEIVVEEFTKHCGDADVDGLQLSAVALADEAERRWAEEGEYVDDITVVVILVPLSSSGN